MKRIKGRRILVVVMVFILFFNTGISVSAKEFVGFSSISTDDGLSQATVQSLLQSKDGHIWIGTIDGLNKYNGNEFEIYREESKNSKSIVNKNIVDIKEEENGDIWIATYGGLSKLNSYGEVVKNYTEGEKSGNLSSNKAKEIHILKNGTILVLTRLGIDKYNKEKDEFYNILKEDKKLAEKINSIDEDGHGNLWIGTDIGLYKMSLESNKVEVYDELNYNGEINKVYCSGKDLYIATNDSFALKLDINNSHVERIDSKDRSLDDNTVINTFLKDSNGLLWMGTNNGLIMYNEETRAKKIYKNKVYDDKSLKNNYVYSIMEDKTGLLWVGTYYGISTFDNKSMINTFRNDPLDSSTILGNSIRGIYEDDEGYLWVGSKDNGLSILDSNKKCIKRIVLDEFNLLSNKISDITGYKENIFVSTENEVLWINKKLNSIEVINKQDGLMGRDIKSIYYYKENFLVINSIGKSEVLDIKAKTVKNINTMFEKYGFYDEYISKIFRDSKGDYYIGGFSGGGILKLDSKSMEGKLYKLSVGEENSKNINSILDIAEDSKGEIWIGTKGGLCKLNSDSYEVEVHTTKEGLPNNNIYGVLIDENDNPWVSTNLGISKYNIETKSFYNLDVYNGLQGNEFNFKSSLKVKNGEFLFGGINGLNSFYTKDIIKEESLEQIKFDSFFVNGIKVENLDETKLSNKKNNLVVKVFYPDYRKNKKMKYYYSLNDKKDSWTLMDGNSINFSNLSPGEYNLKIIGVSSTNIKSDISEINFEVKKPFWFSYTAIFVYLIIIILIYIANKRKLERLDRLVAKRTKDLHIQLDENEEMYKRLIELEKLKNNYFINLSHELRTPLNVSSSAEQLITRLSSRGEITDSKLEYYMGVIRKNNNRLLNLVNNLIDVSRIENGRYVIEKQEVDIVSLVEDVALSLKDYVSEKNIDLIIDPKIEEKVISCDETSIERCILNLVGNAVKFTDEEGQIFIDIYEIEDGVKISVEDTGIGIENEFVNCIFDRFNQVIDEDTEIKGGGGLGLTITREIVELHNGKIYVESEKGKGSKFTIELPNE